MASGGGGSVTAPTPISIARLIVDPNAGARQRIASAGTQRAVDAAERPLEGVSLLSVDTPRGSELLATRVDSYNRRRT